MGEVILLSSDDEDAGFSVPVSSDRAKRLCDDDLQDCDVVFNKSVCSSPPRSQSPGLGSPIKSPWKGSLRATHVLSDSDLSEEEANTKVNPPSSDDDLPDILINFPTNRAEERSASSSDFCSEENSYRSIKKNIVHGGKVNSNKCEDKQKQRLLALEEKQKKKQELVNKREEKKREAAYSKALKQACAELERSKKPGECLKWVTSILDPGLLTCDYSGELLTALRAADLQYRLEETLVPCCIMWERTVCDILQDDELKEVKKTEKVQKEEPLLVVWNWDKLVEMIHDGSLQRTVKEMKSLYSNYKLTIIIYGLEDYFRFQKTQKRRDVRANVLGTDGKKLKGKETIYAAAGQLSRGDIEIALTELQVLHSVCHRTVNSKADLASLVCQFTKAIAETPFKKENFKNKTDKLDWFASADSLNGVAVDKDGKGLFRLWQQQLCQFNLAGLETSEAIVSVYPSPISLINAYKRCSSEKEAELLLQDIPVRRGPGVLSSTRRIGPQLSRKIHLFFSSTNGDEIIV